MQLLLQLILKLQQIHLPASSYLVADANFLKVYDKYNDKYIHIPASSSTAGIMSASDANAAPWVSTSRRKTWSLT